ncbi:MAG: hypothetical protein ABIT07_11310 [Ferruginibacter sp.]
MKVTLGDGQKVWEQSKLFEKNSEQIVSEAGETEDGVFIATTRNNYKLNNQSGEILYNIDMKATSLLPHKKKRKKAFIICPSLIKGQAN